MPEKSFAGSLADLGSEVRTDPLTGRQVIVAPVRGRRPHSSGPARQRRPRARRLAVCPLCPGNEHDTPAAVLTLTDARSIQPWAVRVVPNLYPLVSTGGAAIAPGPALFGRRAAKGIHEVIVETPVHDRELPDREPSEVMLLLEAIQQRLRELEARDATRHVTVFKNKGLEAGTSLEHPHSQIVALDFIPAEVRQRVSIANRYFERKGECLLCAVVDAERKDGSRFVLEAEGFVAFAPFASMSAGETLLVPLTHDPSFTTAPSTAREGLANGLIALLGMIRAAFQDPAYNLLLHTAPRTRRSDAALHWYCHISPRLTRTAGFELATGVLVNPLPPEEVAKLLRETARADHDATPRRMQHPRR